MSKKFVANLFFLQLLNLIVKPLWIFGIDVTVQNLLPVEHYGTYFSLLSFSLLFFLILDFGLANFNNRNVAQDSSFIQRNFGSILTLKLLLAIVYFIVVFIAGYVSGFNGFEMKLLGFLGINQMLLSLIQYLRSNLAALHYFKTDSLLSVLDKTIAIIVCGLFLYGNIFPYTFTIEWFILIQTGSLAVTALMSFILVMYYARGITFSLNLSPIVKILKDTMPYAILGTLMVIYTRIDAVMLKLMVGAEEAGIYAAGFRLLDAINIFAALFATLLLPMFARMIKNNERLQPLVSLSSKMMLLPSLVLVVVCFTYKQNIMDMLYDRSNSYYAQLFGWLMVSFIPFCLIYIFGTLLTANDSIKRLNQFALSTVILNVILNAMLIPSYNALGATYATIITQSFFSASCIIYSFMLFKFKPSAIFVSKLVAFVAILIALAFTLNSQNISHISGTLLLFVTGFALILLLRFFNLKNAFSLIKRNNG